MDSYFTNAAQSVYLTSVTQEKKIQFLQKQIINSQSYTKNLQQDLQSMRLTINRLIKQRTNHQILAKISQNLFRIQRRCKQMEQCLKDSNAKLLIQMQLRIQQKYQYIQKIRQLQIQIQLVRKANKDKEQQFTIIVNKLRKYQDIREFMLDQKINRDSKKSLIIKEQDKDSIIKQLTQQLNYQKKISMEQRPQIDRKIAVLCYSLQNQVNYEALKKQYMQNIKSDKKYEVNRAQYEKKVTNLQNNKNNKTDKTDKNAGRQKINKQNINENTKQLIKQLKKLYISNKLLQTALNESIQQNQQLKLNNQILIDSNKDMRQKIGEYKKKQFNILKKQLIKMQQSRLQSNKSNAFQPSSQALLLKYSQDDSSILENQHIDLAEVAKQKKIKQYLDILKSQHYQINVNQLNKDVNRMSQFLILSLGNKHKSNKFNQKITYSKIIKKQNVKKQNRSLSVAHKNSQLPNNLINNQVSSQVQQKGDKFKINQFNSHTVLPISMQQDKSNDHQNSQNVHENGKNDHENGKNDELSFHIEQY